MHFGTVQRHMHCPVYKNGTKICSSIKYQGTCINVFGLQCVQLQVTAHCHVGTLNLYTVTLKIPLKATKFFTQIWLKSFFTQIWLKCPILDWLEWCCTLWARFFTIFWSFFLMISLKTNINSRHRMTNFFQPVFFVHGQHFQKVSFTKHQIKQNTES